MRDSCQLEHGPASDSPEASGRVIRILAPLAALALLVAACGSEQLVIRDPNFDPAQLFDPIVDGETPPDGYRHSLPRDAIFPVYDPVFVESAGVDWPDDELVIGVDIEGDARAYPVGFLTWREIVNDIHRGIPTLVTW